MLGTEKVIGRAKALRTRAADRDSHQRDIIDIRNGEYDRIAPGWLPEDFPKPLIANLIDTCAHDLSEVMAPLPSVTCASSALTSDKAAKAAEKRTLIANAYLQSSRLAEQMYLGADRYGSFGWMAYVVEPDFDAKMPFIRVEDAAQAYWARDYRGRVVQYATFYNIPKDELTTTYPDLILPIQRLCDTKNSDKVEVLEWRDKDQYRLVIPELNLTLEQVDNPLDECTVRIVPRPTLEGGDAIKGQFDDVIWVQMARALVASYTMSAVDQAVQAPLAVPDDMQELEMGPYSVIQTKTPEKVGRVQLPISAGLFPEQANLAQEQRVGSRYPEGRSGNIDASIVTGQGVQALMGTFDTQIQTFQRLNTGALEDVIGWCFAMDEKLWGSRKKSVVVKDANTPTELKYTPKKDIDGNHSVHASYGAVAGLDPNRSLIFLIQAVSSGFISRETGRKYLPVELDPVAEERRMDVEMFRESVTSSTAALAQAIPAMAAQGQDPREIVQQLNDVLNARKKGSTIEDAVAKVFAPKKKEGEQPQPSELDQALAAAQAQQAGGGQAPGAPNPQDLGTSGASGSPEGDLLMQLAGISPSGNANLQANVSRQEQAQ